MDDIAWAPGQVGTPAVSGEVLQQPGKNLDGGHRTRLPEGGPAGGIRLYFRFSVVQVDAHMKHVASPSFGPARSHRSWLLLSLLAGASLQVVQAEVPEGVEDTDGDGKLSTAEFQAYAGTRIPGFGKDQLKAFSKRVDADGDGTITLAEFGKRREVLRAMAEGEPAPAVPKKDSGKEEAEDKAKDSQESTPPAPPATKADPKPATIDDWTRESASVLLITSEELREAWSEFANWKTRLGKKTKVVTVKEISQVIKAKTVQEQIRKFVRAHIEKAGTRWVVLGGDCLPDSKGHVPGGHRTVHAQEPEGIPTDIVYLSPTDWDADGDGIHGEFKDDREAITYPDGKVGLGRIPVRTKEDVAAFTAKVKGYESKYPTDAFATNMIYTCTDRPAYAKVRKSWDDHVSTVWKAGKAGRFFSQETPWDEEGEPGSYPLSPDNLVGLINKKSTGKLHIHGHGLLPLWVLEGNKTFRAGHVAKLDHENYYPLITTVSCNTGEYDNAKDPSIVESMLRKPKGGSVAIVAPIRTGKPHFHNPRRDFPLMVRQGKLDGTTMTMTRYWKGGLGENLTTGVSLMQAKSAMAKDAQKTAGYHLCICELNLLGDPTLDMRAQVPKTPKLECPAKVEPGKQTIEVVTDAPGALVCLWKEGEHYSAVEADPDGKTAFQVDLKTAGMLQISVTGSSLNAVSREVPVQKVKLVAQ